MFWISLLSKVWPSWIHIHLLEIRAHCFRNDCVMGRFSLSKPPADRVNFTHHYNNYMYRRYREELDSHVCVVELSSRLFYTSIGWSLLKSNFIKSTVVLVAKIFDLKNTWGNALRVIRIYHYVVTVSRLHQTAWRRRIINWKDWISGELRSHDTNCHWAASNQRTWAHWHWWLS